MTLIGCRCTWGDPFSRAVLITRTLLLKVYFTKFQYVQYNSRKRLANIKAVIAQGLHLLPFRTEKLNLATPMVLPTRERRKRPPYRGVLRNQDSSFFVRTHRPPPVFSPKGYQPFGCEDPAGGGEVTTERTEVHGIKLPSVGGVTGITEFNECRLISLRSND